MTSKVPAINPRVTAYNSALREPLSYSADAWGFKKRRTADAVKKIASPVIVCTVVGAAAGATAGIPGGPPGILIGAGIGAGVGFGVGILIAGAIVYKYPFTNFNEWVKLPEGKAWLALHDSEEVGIVFYTEFSNRTELERLFCPITSCLIQNPVKIVQVLPNGTMVEHVYERKGIERWIEEHGTDPQTRKDIQKRDLEEAPERVADNYRALKNFLVEESNLVGLDERARNGLLAFKQDLDEQRRYLHQVAINKIEKEHKGNPSQLAAAREQIDSVYLG